MWWGLSQNARTAVWSWVIWTELITFIVFLVLHINEILTGVCSKNVLGRHGVRSQCSLRRKRERRKQITLLVPREFTLQSWVRKLSSAGQETDRSRQERGAPGKEKICQGHRLVSLLWIISSGFGTLEVFVRCLGSGSGKTGQGEHFGLVWDPGTWDWLACKEKSLFGGNLVIYSGLNSPDGGRHFPSLWGPQISEYRAHRK